MNKILDQNLFNKLLKGNREYFPRATAFYNNDSLATKISKIVFPIFIICFLALTIRDGIDISLSKKHYKKISPIKKYSTAIAAVGIFGYFTYRLLSNNHSAHIRNFLDKKSNMTWPNWKIYSSIAVTSLAFSIILGLSHLRQQKKPIKKFGSQKSPKLTTPTKTTIQAPLKKVPATTEETGHDPAITLKEPQTSFESDSVVVKKAYAWEDKHKLAIQQLRAQAEELDLFNFLEFPEVSNARFSSWIYYLNQRQSFAYNLQQCLRALRKDSEYDQYQIHKDFITHFRGALSCPESLVSQQKDFDGLEAMRKLEELAYSRFTKTSFLSYLESLLDYSTTFKDDETISLKSISNKLKKYNEEIHQNKSTSLYVAWEKLKGATNILFDPQSEHNLPYARSLFSIKSKLGEKTVTHLRHSTPTRSSLLRSASVIEEFEGFLKSAKSKNEIVGYFNLQDQSSGSDGERARAIKDLQNSHDNFFVWSLPFDGPEFLLSEKADSSQVRPTKFASMPDHKYKELLINEFFRKKQNANDQPIRFAIPEFYWKNENENARKKLKKDLTDLLEDIHRFYFNNEDLANNVVKRRTMTLLFYAHLVDFSTADLGLDFVTTSCKDNKDRGGAMNAICEIVRMIKTNQYNDSDKLKKLFIHVLGAGLHTKDEHILENRLIFLTQTLDHIASLSKTQIQSIRDYFNNVERFGKISDFNYIEDSLTLPSKDLHT